MATDGMKSITSLAVGVGGVAGDVKQEAPPRDKEAALKQQLERQNLAEMKAEIAEQVEVTRETLERVVSDLKDYVQNMQRDLNFHVDDETGRVVIKVIDSSTSEVIRQIPEEEVLSLARRMQEMLEDMPKGMLLRGEV